MRHPRPDDQGGAVDSAIGAERQERGVSKLAGQHILIAEDEMLIAFTLVDTLTALGCTSVVVSRVAKAVSLAELQTFDAAIIDLNLDGSLGYPIVDTLKRRGIPFVIATGFDPQGIHPAYAKLPRLAKPYLPHDVETALLRSLGALTLSSGRVHSQGGGESINPPSFSDRREPIT